MFSKRFLKSTFIANRYYSQGKQSKKFAVAIVGGAGGIGQPLSLLFKLNPSIIDLRLHDLAHVPGVAADLSHIETAAKVSHSTAKDYGELFKGGVDMIVVAAGVPRKPGMKREDLFTVNAKIAYDVARDMAQHTPHAILLLITNPVNSLVPVACEVLKGAGKLCPGKVFGVSTLDSVRTNTFVAEMNCLDPKDVTVPLVGGHSGTTILPLLSRTNPKVCIEGEKQAQLIKRIQNAGTEVVKAKAGKGSATLSTAYATSRLAFAVLRGLSGESNIVESAYVMSDVYPELRYLATPLLLGPNGVEKNLGLGKMSEAEEKLFCAAVKDLKKDIEVGEKFAKEQICKNKK